MTSSDNEDEHPNELTDKEHMYLSKTLQTIKDAKTYVFKKAIKESDYPVGNHSGKPVDMSTFKNRLSVSNVRSTLEEIE